MFISSLNSIYCVLQRRSEADEMKFFRWRLTGRRMAERKVVGGRRQDVMEYSRKVRTESAIEAEERWGQQGAERLKDILRVTWG